VTQVFELQNIATRNKNLEVEGELKSYKKRKMKRTAKVTKKECEKVAAKEQLWPDGCLVSSVH